MRRSWVRFPSGPPNATCLSLQNVGCAKAQNILQTLNTTQKGNLVWKKFPQHNTNSLIWGKTPQAYAEDLFRKQIVSKSTLKTEQNYENSLNCLGIHIKITNAYGECLGSLCRWRTCKSALSLGKLTRSVITGDFRMGKPNLQKCKITFYWNFLLCKLYR